MSGLSKTLASGGVAALAATLALQSPALGSAMRQAIEAIVGLSGPPLEASRGVLSEHEIEEIGALPPQQQAERLLQRAVNRFEGAAEEIEARVDSWRGRLHYDGRIESLTHTAYNSADLRVRAAAVEISLAAYGIDKTPEAAQELLQTISVEQNPVNKPYLLWTLALLANRGFEQQAIFDVLLDHLNDPEQETRKWAVNSIGMIGASETVPVLLDVFRMESSLIVKERAACNLAESGMLTKEQRESAIPDLVRLADNPVLEPIAQEWVFQALRDITGEAIASDASEWRLWAAQKNGY